MSQYLLQLKTYRMKFKWKYDTWLIKISYVDHNNNWSIICVLLLYWYPFTYFINTYKKCPFHFKARNESLNIGAIFHNNHIVNKSDCVGDKNNNNNM